VEALRALHGTTLGSRWVEVVVTQMSDLAE